MAFVLELQSLDLSEELHPCNSIVTSYNRTACRNV